MAIERSPDFEFRVGRSDEAEHRAMLDRPRTPTGSASPTGCDRAFAILRGLGDAHGNLYLKRVAVARPGRAGHAVPQPRPRGGVRAEGAERLYLDCFADNAPAQAAY